MWLVIWCCRWWKRLKSVRILCVYVFEQSWSPKLAKNRKIGEAPRPQQVLFLVFSTISHRSSQSKVFHLKKFARTKRQEKSSLRSARSRAIQIRIRLMIESEEEVHHWAVVVKRRDSVLFQQSTPSIKKLTVKFYHRQWVSECFRRESNEWKIRFGKWETSGIINPKAFWYQAAFIDCECTSESQPHVLAWTREKTRPSASRNAQQVKWVHKSCVTKCLPFRGGKTATIKFLKTRPVNSWLITQWAGDLTRISAHRVIGPPSR